MNKDLIEYMRSIYKAGNRVKLISMEGEEHMKHGDTGTITKVDDAGQIHVRWDNKGSLALQLDRDEFIKM